MTAERTPVTALKPVYHDGKSYEVGQKFDMLTTHVKDGVRTNLVVVRDVSVEIPEPEKVEPFANEKEELVSLQKLWQVDSPDMTPAQYVEKFPQGPVSDLAMRIVELEAEATETA